MPNSNRTDYPTARTIGGIAGRLIYGGLVVYLVVLVVFKSTWDMLVPSLFPGAVEQGLVAKTISWWTAFLLSGAGTLVLLWSRWITSSWLGAGSDRIALIETKVNAIAAHLGIVFDAAKKAEVDGMGH